MKAQTIKLEIQQELSSASDADLLSKLKWNLEKLFEQDNAPGEGDSILKEPEPMTDLRAAVKQLVDQVSDAHVLASVLAFLRGDKDDLQWRTVLSARIAKAEADFVAGRVYTQEQLEAHFKGKSAR